MDDTPIRRSLSATIACGVAVAQLMLSGWTARTIGVDGARVNALMHPTHAERQDRCPLTVDKAWINLPHDRSAAAHMIACDELPTFICAQVANAVFVTIPECSIQEQCVHICYQVGRPSSDPA